MLISPNIVTKYVKISRVGEEDNGGKHLWKSEFWAWSRIEERLMVSGEEEDKINK